MKKSILLLIAIMTMVHASAQDVEVVTLQNGDDVQLFLGPNAFIEALDAAENGNVITLSPGRYNATDITKPVTIYGSGYETKADSLSVAEGKALYPTILYGNFDISLDSLDQQSNHLYMEGIYFSGHIYSNIVVTKYLQNASFLKCRFKNFDFTSLSYNCNFFQCRFENFGPGEAFSMNLSNSIVKLIKENKQNSSLLVSNSLLFSVSESINAIFKNCIIADVTIDGYLKGHCSLYNCMLAKDKIGNYIEIKQGNWIDEEYAMTLWGVDNIAYNDTCMYRLTEEAQRIYLGTDGTQIGIYGGSQPFNTKLTIPRVVKRNIASKTENGKLKVNIEVEAGDESF